MLLSNISVYRLEVPINDGTYGPLSAGIHDPKYKKVCSEYRSSLSGIVKDPWEDGCSVFDSDMVCGAVGVIAMLNCIPIRGVYDELIRVGFSLNLYSVPSSKIFHGGTQSVWHPQHARFVETATLTGLVDTWRKSKVV